MLGLPLNPGCINCNHTHGTHAPVEEPSTASEADMRFARVACSREIGISLFPGRAFPLSNHLAKVFLGLPHAQP
jgi:hypothetical protein